MSWSRWFRIVSTRIAVFPVVRSPMISSRWPRPIGIIESIAFRPVCSGSFTGWRSITPGALNSSSRLSSDSIGPLPSSGSPSGLTMRPISPSPTGTLATRPVRRAGRGGDGADQVGVDVAGRLDLAAGRLLDAADEVALLLVGQVDGRRQLDVEDALGLGDDPVELARDLVDLRSAALFDHEE